MVDEAGTAIGLVLRFVSLCFPVAVDNFSYIVSYKCFVLFSCASLLLWIILVTLFLINVLFCFVLFSCASLLLSIIFSNIVSYVCFCALVMDDFNCFTC